MSFADKFTAKSNSGFTAKIIKEKALVYELSFPETDGAFFILEVDRAKHKDFTRVIKESCNIDLKDYGNILYSGYGMPSNEVKDLLRKKYGLYED
jgi:hypothetical protein